MRKKDWAFLGGLCTIVVALTDWATSGEWREVHTVAAVAGGIAMIGGAA